MSDKTHIIQNNNLKVNLLSYAEDIDQNNNRGVSNDANTREASHTNF